MNKLITRLLSNIKYTYLIFILLNTSYLFAANNSVSNKMLKILFVGNSFLGWNDMPNTFKELAENNSKNVYLENHIKFGRSLYELVTDDIFNNKLQSTDWDYIIAQDSPYRIAYPEEFIESNRHIAALRTIKYKIENSNNTAKVIVFMPWAYMDGKFWDEESPEDYFQMQEKVITNSINFAGELNYKIAPAGHAWGIVVRDSSSIELFEPDLTHPTSVGIYLNSCVLFTTIFYESLNNKNYIAALQPETALYLQNIASSTVFDKRYNNDLTSIESSNIDNNITLSQNYPNPFNTQTNISFSVSKKEYVSLKIFNNLGQKLITLVSSEKQKGTYKIIFDAKSLTSGIYYYRLNTSSESITKTMLLIK